MAMEYFSNGNNINERIRISIFHLKVYYFILDGCVQALSLFLSYSVYVYRRVVIEGGVVLT